MPRHSRRVFSAAFKAEVLRELLTGQRSHAELCREHQLSPSLLTLWKDAALERLGLLFEDRQQRDPQQARIDDLEQLVGRQTLELEILKKASRRLHGHPDTNGRSS
jgi:transposase